MKHQYVLFGLVGLTICGCRTSPVRVSDSQPVPPKRIFAGYQQYSHPTTDSAKAIVIRDSGIPGSALKVKLSIDGHHLATFGRGNKLEFYVTPGSHILGVARQSSATYDETAFTFGPGVTQYFRISAAESSFRIQPSTQID